MKTTRFTITDGREMIERGLEIEADHVEAWGVMCFGKEFANPDADPVEGVIVEWEIDGEDAHLTVLMSDDHAARLAVSPEVDANVIWEPGR